MKREFRIHAQHPARVAYGKSPEKKLKIAVFTESSLGPCHKRPEKS